MQILDSRLFGNFESGNREPPGPFPDSAGTGNGGPGGGGPGVSWSWFKQLSWVSASHRDKAQDAFIYVKQRPAAAVPDL